MEKLKAWFDAVHDYTTAEFYPLSNAYVIISCAIAMVMVYTSVYLTTKEPRSIWIKLVFWLITLIVVVKLLIILIFGILYNINLGI